MPTMLLSIFGKTVQKRICTNIWNVNNMNEILFEGDKLYKYTKKNSKTYHDYLEPCDLPSFLFHLTTSIITGKWKKKSYPQWSILSLI